MELSIDGVAKFADVVLALMDEEISKKDRTSFHIELGKYFEAMQMMGVGGGGGAGETCRFTGIRFECSSRKQGGGIARAAQTSGRGPVRWGSSWCVRIPGTDCSICIDWECTPE